MSASALKRTPFHEMHVRLRGKMVPFAGYELPVQYPTGITKEHEAVRTAVGVFDVSHMGEFEFTGPDRNARVNRLTCNDVAALQEGQAHYTAMLTDEGTFIDDCIIYRFDDRIMMVVNAANTAKDWSHVVASKGSINARVKNISDDVALLAVQGPQAEGLLQSLTPVSLADIGYYRFEIGQMAGVECFIARTGYTGEDGFELYFRPAQAETVWHAVAGQGRAVPALYGNDIDETVNPYEARLGWIVKLQKGVTFRGLQALEAVKAKGPTRRLVGFKCNGRAIPRHGNPVYLNGRRADIARSGGFGPSIGVGIGTTFLPTHSEKPGTLIEIECRGQRFEGEVVSMPFYRNGSAKKA